MNLSVGRRTQGERSAETRRRILDAAVRSLHQKGYGATTTTAVLELAGISRGALFHHFPTKTDMMLEVVETVYQAELTAYRSLLRPDKKEARPILAVINLVWDRLSQPSGIAVLEIMVGSRSDPDLRDRLGPLQKAIEDDALLNTRRYYESQGVRLSDQDIYLQRLLIAAIRGLVIEDMFIGDRASVLESIARLASMIEREAAAPE